MAVSTKTGDESLYRGSFRVGMSSITNAAAATT